MKKGCKVVKLKTFNKLVLSLIGSSLLGASVFAQQVSSGTSGASNSTSLSNTSTSALPQAEKDPVDKPFKILMVVEGESNFYSEESPDRERNTSLVIAPSYLWSNGVGLSSLIAFSRDEIHPGEETWENTSLRLSKTFEVISGRWSLSPGLLGVLPTNEKDRKEKSYQGAGGFNFVSIFPIKSLTLTHKIGFNRNFHGYERDSEGLSNIQYTIRNDLIADWEFIKSWTLSGTYTSREAWVYQGSMRHSYENEFSLSKEISSVFSVSAGWRNKGSVFKADGISNNIDILDSNKSLFFLALNVSQ